MPKSSHFNRKTASHVVCYIEIGPVTEGQRLIAKRTAKPLRPSYIQYARRKFNSTEIPFDTLTNIYSLDKTFKF